MTMQRWMYRGTEGELERVAAVSSVYLHVWEYEPASEESWVVTQPEGDLVRRWRTRSPDLAPAEILVGETTFDAPATAHLVPPLPQRGTSAR